MSSLGPFPNINDETTGYIRSYTIHNQNIKNISNADDATSYKLIIRQLQSNDFFHVAILYHQYRVFYKSSINFSKELTNFISFYIADKILSKSTKIDSYEEIISNDLFPNEILSNPDDKKALQDFCKSTFFLSQRLMFQQSAIFTIYLENSSNDYISESVLSTILSKSSKSTLIENSFNELNIIVPSSYLIPDITPTSNIVTLSSDNTNVQKKSSLQSIYWTPIAFVQMSFLFSTVSLSTDYYINDLFAHPDIRNVKCGTNLLYQVIDYTRDVLKPLNNNSSILTSSITKTDESGQNNNDTTIIKNAITLSIRTQFTNQVGQYLYPHVGFIEVERNERLQRFIYEMKI